MFNLINRAANKILGYLVSAKYILAGWLSGRHEFGRWAFSADNAHVKNRFVDLGELWGDRARSQFEFLRRIGLKPGNLFLDYGCAHLATGLEIIPYLGTGNYVGVDVSPRVIERGVRRLSANGISRNSYHVFTVSHPDLPELTGFNFDYIFAYSSLQYLSPDSFRHVVANLGALLAPGGKFIVTVSDGSNSKELRAKGMSEFMEYDYRVALESQGGIFHVEIEIMHVNQNDMKVPLHVFTLTDKS